jgi:putative phosphoesterase
MARMAVGLLYDVHGNLPALEAVLRDARDTPVASWVLGGDYASFGAWPAEVVARQDELQDAVWLRGNWDRWQAGERDDFPDDPDLKAGLAAAIEGLGPELVARLGALQATHLAGDTLYCHGAPGTDMASFLPQATEHDDVLLAGVTARRVVFGHTHLPVDREHGGIRLVNPGSVGLPFDGDPRASWAVLHGDGRVELRRVEYDLDETCAALARRFDGSRWVQGTIDRLRAASFVV